VTTSRSKRCASIASSSAQEVAGPSGLDGVRRTGSVEASAQVGHVDLDRVGRRPGCRVTPDELDEPLGGDRLVRVQEQHGEHGPLLRGTELQRHPSATTSSEPRIA
jgi:hypothetical protein